MITIYKYNIKYKYKSKCKIKYMRGRQGLVNIFMLRDLVKKLNAAAYVLIIKEREREGIKLSFCVKPNTIYNIFS